MPVIARAPPVVGLALAAGAGAVLFHLGVPLFWALPLALSVFLPKATSPGPAFLSLGLTLALLAGFLCSRAGEELRSGDCRFHLGDQQALMVSGRLLGPVLDGRGEIQPLGPGNECARPLRFVLAGKQEAWTDPGSKGGVWTDPGGWGPGASLRLVGRWSKDPVPVSASRAGYLRVDSATHPLARRPGSLAEARVALGGWVQRRLAFLFPESVGLASALIWARKDGLDPGLREAFARTGTAHLLAISGFHVGVFAALFLCLLGWLGVPHGARFLLSAAGIWLYVGAIGLPDAAVRAAVLLSVFSVGRLLDRAVVPSGALATVFLGFLLVDPTALLRVGFQLSLAGTAGLIVGFRPMSRWMTERAPSWVPATVLQGTAAGVAASLATLPFVAWHFGRISLVGIPFTLLATPLVATVIPGVLASLLLSLVHAGAARFLASGIDLALQALAFLIRGGADLPFASAWVSHPMVMAGVLMGSVVASLRLVFPGIRKQVGILGVAGAVATGLAFGNPLARVLSLGIVELVVLDVGQGDATLIRSPGGRWILVDTGPRTQSFDAGERRILPYLEQRGVESLEVLILTHPDMDHVGGAASLLARIPVGRVLGPGVPAGTGVFVDALESAQDAGVPWSSIQAGDSLNLDGMALRVLAPERGREDRESGDPNALSVVLELRFGAFYALLTGDAPAASEREFLPRILSTRITALKVGHHGSATSTSPALVLKTRPELALVSVGRRNRFGHPAPDVVGRLRKVGARVIRTDLNGNLVLRVGEDGTVRTLLQHPQDPDAGDLLRR